MDTEDILLEAEISGSEDEADDERKHNKLVDAISSLDGKNKHRLSQRTEWTNQVSEFNFARSGEGASKVKLHELVGSLKDTAKLGNLKRQFNIIDKRKTVVSTPLPKHEKEKIERTIAYEGTKQDLSKWSTVVTQNKLADQLHFPLQKPDFKLATIDDFVKRFKLRTPLEVQVAALLKGSDHVVQDKQQELTPAEQRALRAMNLEEARQRHAELMKHKALLSYREAKVRWRNKIKSKRYHRILKKTQLKQEMKALEELEKKDPESYAEKLKQLERDRVQERMSLKHRGGSKYAKRQMIYAKYDDKAREQVQDMLQKSRELTKKMEVEEQSETESEGGVSLDSDDETQLQSEKGANPWMKKVRPTVKDNPWMLKSVLTAKSDYSRPEALGSNSDKVENDSDTGKDKGIANYVNSALFERTSKTEGRNKSFDDTKRISPGKGSSKARKDDDNDEDNNNNEVDDEDDVQRDDIDKIFSSVSKKSKISKSESKKKVKRKKKEKKQKIKVKKADIVKKQKHKSRDDLDKISSDKKKKENVDEKDDNDDPLISEGLSRKRTLEEIENSDSDADVEELKKVRKGSEKDEEGVAEKKTIEKEVFVDPQNLFTLDSKLKQVGAAPGLVDDDEGDLDPEEQQRMTIAQAFADDDVIEEFQRDKEAEIDKNKPKDIDLSLPGWGEWGGSGIVVSKRKRKRFRIKAPPAAPRRDMHLGNVIINEQKAAPVKMHQVSELPYPFLNVEQFEKSIRAPLGKTWNPETAYRELVKPKVVTKLGKIIMPIDKSEVFAKDKEFKKSQQNHHSSGNSRKKHVKGKKVNKRK